MPLEATDRATAVTSTAQASTAERRTIESVKGTERVLEVLKVLGEEDERQAAHSAAWRRPESSVSDTAPRTAVPNLLLLGLDDGAYLLKAILSVRATELEQGLLLMPFDAAVALLGRLLKLLPISPHAELTVRCALLVIKVYDRQIRTHRSILQTLHLLDQALANRMDWEQLLVGYNLAALHGHARSGAWGGTGRRTRQRVSGER